MSASTLEVLRTIYESELNLESDLEIADFVAENRHLVNSDELFDNLPEGFYNTWSALVMKKYEETSSGLYKL